MKKLIIFSLFILFGFAGAVFAADGDDAKFDELENNYIMQIDRLGSTLPESPAATAAIDAAAADALQTVKNQRSKLNAKSNAKPITIYGTVVDGENNEPLGSVPVISVSEPSKLYTQTGNNGKFEIKNIPSNDQIKITFLGYKEKILNIPNGGNFGEIKLEESSEELEAVELTGTFKSKPCTDQQLPANAKAGNTKLNDQTENVDGHEQQKVICVPTECNDGFKTENNACVPVTTAETTAPTTPTTTTPATTATTATTDKTDKSAPTPKPGLTAEQHAAKVADLKDNSRAMHEKEQSLANRTIGAAAIGATGIGAMNMLSGMAEKSADQAAEQDMKAHLETMRCEYANGRGARGGETEIMLPGSGNLMPLRTEYTLLAGNLKTTKEQLGLMPGIESETIFDIADANLYANEATGKTGGAFTSVARALSDPGGADAAAWARQTSDAADKTKTGMITAAAGIGVGVVGNLLVNQGGKTGNNIFGQKVATESSAKINDKYAKMIPTTFKKMETEFKSNPPADTCPAGTTGTYPNCNCGDTRITIFLVEAKACKTCLGGMVNTNEECKCPPEKPNTGAGGVCEPKKPECKLTGLVKKDVCECVEHAEPDEHNECECELDFDEVEGSNECKAKQLPVTKAVDARGLPLSKSSIDLSNVSRTFSTLTAIPDRQNSLTKISLQNANLFRSGESTLSPTAKATISKFMKETIPRDFKTGGATDEDLANLPICIHVIGHTDRSAGTDGRFNNQKLSEDRANAVAAELKANGSALKSMTIQTKGVGPEECQKPEHPKNSDEACRRVDLTVYPNACPG
jgi:flagellar motor protein MotB